MAVILDYVNYPMVLPSPSANFSGSHSSPTQTTPFTSGKIRKRKIGRTATKKATMEWLFDPDEYDIFAKWWEEDLNSGCSPFQIDMVGGGNGQRGRHVVQLVGDPSFSHEECNWRVSVECVIYPYPKLSNEALLQVVFADPTWFSIELTKTVESYYERN